MPPSPSRTIVTTTLWRNEPSSTLTAATSPPNKSKLPIGAIVGGLLGGVLLAVVAVAAWIRWGRSIERQRRKQQKELATLRATEKNTRLNASSAVARPRAGQYLPSALWPPASTKVKFADANQPPADPEPQQKDKAKAVDPPPIPVRRPTRPTALSSDPNPSSGVIFPWRKKSVERIAAERPSPAPDNTADDDDSDSTSYYSMENEPPVELAAPHSDTNPRLSRSSSMWSFLLRNGFRRPSTNTLNPGGNRNSQATSVSMYSQPEEPLPVGVAI